MKNNNQAKHNSTVTLSARFFILLLLLCILNSCGAVIQAPLSTESTNSVSPTIEKTMVEMPTSTPTPEPTATLTPEPTPTATQIPCLNPVRPVDISVPIYHCYGVPIGTDSAHNGYDYGFEGYDSSYEVGYPVVSIADGNLVYAKIDGNEGAIFIDHGVVQLTNGDSMRVVSSYWHIIPLPTLLGGPQGNVGLNIWKGDSIADFCSTCGTSPEVELQIIGLDPKETQYLFETLYETTVARIASIFGRYSPG